MKRIITILVALSFFGLSKTYAQSFRYFFIANEISDSSVYNMSAVSFIHVGDTIEFEVSGDTSHITISNNFLYKDISMVFDILQFDLSGSHYIFRFKLPVDHSMNYVCSNHYFRNEYSADLSNDTSIFYCHFNTGDSIPVMKFIDKAGPRMDGLGKKVFFFFNDSLVRIGNDYEISLYTGQDTFYTYHGEYPEKMLEFSMRDSAYMSFRYKDIELGFCLQCIEYYDIFEPICIHYYTRPTATTEELNMIRFPQALFVTDGCAWCGFEPALEKGY